MDKPAPLRVSLLGGLCSQPRKWHAYQRYYLTGLRRLPGVRVSYGNLIDRPLAWGWERGWPRAARTWEYIASRQAGRRYPEANHIGRYLLYFPGYREPLRVVIDHYDARGIRDPKAYDWAQLYFKVNRWPTFDYGPKVRPLVSGNGYLSDARLARFIALRESPKELDLVLIAKLWPGLPGPTFWHPVEHLVRVFETLAKLKVRSVLRATVPVLIAQKFPQHYLDRLSNCGVQVTQPGAPGGDLWTAISTARLVCLRPGRFLSTSWRLIDHLAMGVCTVYDRAPYAEWPVPLRAGHEFVDCECGIGADESLPENASYERIAETVMSWLADPERAAGVREAAAAYFDLHVAHEPVARYLIDTAEQYLAFSGSSPPKALDERTRSSARAAA